MEQLKKISQRGKTNCSPGQVAEQKTLLAFERISGVSVSVSVPDESNVRTHEAVGSASGFLSGALPEHGSNRPTIGGLTLDARRALWERSIRPSRWSDLPVRDCSDLELMGLAKHTFIDSGQSVTTKSYKSVN